MLIDSHVNLHGEKFADDLPDVIENAKSAGVKGMLNICCNIKDYQATLDVANMSDAIWASVGTHPHDAKDSPELKPEDLIEMAAHPKVIGIGETGYDFHYGYSSEAEQIYNFQTHIDAAREAKLPLIIHTREADDLMIKTLEREMGRGEFFAIMHCYTSGDALARTAIDMGFYFSVSGIVTFKNAHDVRGLVEIMPDDKIMIETDCPYLAPVPYRGRRNEPAYVHEVCEGLAAVKGWSYEEAAQKTTDAFFNLFQKADRSLLWD